MKRVIMLFLILMISLATKQLDNDNVSLEMVELEYKNPEEETNNCENAELCKIEKDYKEQETGSCAICLDELNLVKIIAETICKHRFHQECLDEWIANVLREKNTSPCPLCRTDLLKYVVEGSGKVVDVELRRIGRLKSIILKKIYEFVFAIGYLYTIASVFGSIIISCIGTSTIEYPGKAFYIVGLIMSFAHVIWAWFLAMCMGQRPGFYDADAPRLIRDQDFMFFFLEAIFTLFSVFSNKPKIVLYALLSIYFSLYFVLTKSSIIPPILN